MKYTPKTLDEVRRCLGGCSGQTPVEVEDGIPVTAKTVADLRALSTWPPGDWVLDVPHQWWPATQRRKGGMAFLHQSLTCWGRLLHRPRHPLRRLHTTADGRPGASGYRSATRCRLLGATGLATNVPALLPADWCSCRRS
jgi:hypothetical protein